MGTLVRLQVEAGEGEAHQAEQALGCAEQLLRRFDRELTRFSEDSELARLNVDPAPTVAVPPLLRRGVEAALAAARDSDGLLDPTVIGALERVGYATTRRDAPTESLREAIRLAPPRRPARSDPAARWRLIEVDAEAGTVRRPPGVRIDLGGVGKGLAADLAAVALAVFPSFAVDCGGDLAVGGTRADGEPRWIGWQNPFEDELAATVELRGGGLASSGIDVRLWRRPDRRYNHHLLDPASGEPAWTGVVAATARGRTALEADTLAKLALLRGPAAGRELLAERGGLLVLDDGGVEAIGPIRVSWL